MLSITRRFALLLLPIIACAVPAGAANLPTNFTETLIASGLNSPTAMELAPDGRIFVCEQGGQLRVIKDGALLSTPFVSLTVGSGGERGLVGVTVDPNFAVNHFLYVYYTATTPTIHNRVSRFTANGDVAAAGSEFVLLDLDDLNALYHNGGALNFGPDGKLYVGVGENQVGTNAQSLGNLLGKMLRINADGSIPTDNPFFNTASGKNRAIWAMGLRNPFSFGFSRSGSMFINDVGESTWEEIDDGVAGANYGWPNTEGPTTVPGFWSPRYSYIHDGTICAIVGSAFYTPLNNQFPSDYSGTYLFADYCAGWIKRLDPANGNAITTFATGISSPVDLKVSDDGSLYYLARGASATAGSVSRVSYGGTGPSITTQPVSQTVLPGVLVTLSVRASGPGTLRYQWQLNGINIPGATSPNFTTLALTLADDGAKYRVLVSNDFDSVFSDIAILRVIANAAPTAQILSPASGSTYSGGSVIQFSGSGKDLEDGTLPASAFTWQVDFHHDSQVQTVVPPTSGSASGSYTVPTSQTSTNVFYRVLLTVKDSSGLTATAQVDVLPRKASLTLATSPAGLQVTLDGQSTAAPLSFDSVAGIVHTLGAPATQLLNGTSYQFASWSDGGAATHNISGPLVNTTYTATYTAVAGAPPPIGGTGTGLSATYYDNVDFTGTSITRIDPTIDFAWDGVGPAPQIQPETFSARWTAQVEAPVTDTYTFYTQSDDGVRLWVNGQLLIDNWTDHAVAEDQGTITLTAGQRYDLRLEFYQNTDVAVARLLWSTSTIAKAVVASTRLYPQAYVPPPGTPPPSSPPPSDPGTGTGLSATYYDNIDLTGPTVTRLDPTVDFFWGYGSPDPQIGPDSFSARWTGQVEAPVSETYTFYTQTDDGVRLWVNNQLLIDNWRDQAASEVSATITLTAGQRYDIRMEYYEYGGMASARLLWSSTSIPKAVVPTARLYPQDLVPPTAPVLGGDTGNGLSATYFDNLDFTGTTVTQVDPTVDFMWGTAAPVTGIQPDTFSVRWTGQVAVPLTDTYTFYTQADDGVRLWVNGQVLVNNWADHATQENSGTIELVAGQRYDIVMEYYQDGLDATARLLWSSSAIQKTVLPSTSLFPTVATP